MTDDGGGASFAIPVYAGDALQVVSGANQGDGLGPAEELSPGDVYRILPGSEPRTLAIENAGIAPSSGSGAPVLRPETDTARVAAASEAGSTGAPLRPAARLTMLAPDGHSVDLMVLEIGADAPQRVVFAQGPVETGLAYVLAGVSPPGEMRLADVVPFAFAAGTRIAMADGSQRAVETLREGETVLTRDRGALPLRAVLRHTERALGPNAPVVIAAETFGNPGDLVLSQHQRLLVYQREEDRLTETAEMLVRAGDLVDGDRVFMRRGGFVDYVALVLDSHEMLYAECIAVESLEVGPATRHRLAEAHAQAVDGLEHRPHFGSEAGRDIAAAARARLLGRVRPR